MIDGRRLTMQYAGGITALSDVTVTIGRGEFVFLLGPSGAGKTTLLSLLAGLHRPQQGELIVDGVDLVRASDGQRRALRRRIGIVSQNFQLVGRRKARENIELGLRVLGMGGNQLRSRAEEALAAVNLPGRGEQRLDSLSWGEQQRVALARALARRPQLILADEPTGNLDEDNARAVFELLQGAQHQGMTVVVATHATAFAQSIGQRLLYLEGGRLLEGSTATDAKERNVL